MSISASDTDIDNLISRVEFFDSCIDQVRRELPVYLSKQAGLEKHHKALAKILRAVGSSETNQKLQNVMFHYSQKHELFEKERGVYGLCEQNVHDSVDEAKKLLVLPLKEIIADHKVMEKANGSASSTKQDANMKVGKSDITDARFVQSTLQVHAKLFEKHRVQSLKKLLNSLLCAELQYHCRVVEELSSVLQDLAVVDENEL